MVITLGLTNIKKLKPQAMLNQGLISPWLTKLDSLFVLSYVYIIGYSTPHLTFYSLAQLSK